MAIGKLRLAGVAPEQPDASERLAAAVVEVTYRLARKTENNAKFFGAQIEDSDPTLTTLAHVVQLIQL